MGLIDDIRAKVAANQFEFSDHALGQSLKRNITVIELRQAVASGEVIEVNAKVADDPELMKRDPFGAGWIAKIRLAGGATLDHLLDAAAYEEQINSEPH